VAELVTVNGVPAVPVGGDVADTALTFGSALTRMLVVRGLLVFELLPGVGSVTWSWSTTVDAVVVKVWLDGLVQVTFQLGPTEAVTDTARTVF
jgi:hypothetical protein